MQLPCGVSHPTTELQPSSRVQGGSLRSPRAARPPAGPALLSPPRSNPAGARAARTAISRLMPEKGYVVAGAVGSTALGSHFCASLEDHGPNVVLHRAGPQTARRAASLRGHDHSRQSSSSPKPLHRPRSRVNGGCPPPTFNEVRRSTTRQPTRSNRGRTIRRRQLDYLKAAQIEVI